MDIVILVVVAALVAFGLLLDRHFPARKDHREDDPR